MDRQEVIAEILALELQADQYIVAGGASMTIRGLRDTSDIDLVVTQELFDRLSALEWVQKPRPNGQPGLKRGRVEVYLDVTTPSHAPSIEWLLARADFLAGIPLVDLDTLLAWKQGYGREKDQRDVELLQSLRSGGQGCSEPSPIKCPAAGE